MYTHRIKCAFAEKSAKSVDLTWFLDLLKEEWAEMFQRSVEIVGINYESAFVARVRNYFFHYFKYLAEVLYMVSQRSVLYRILKSATTQRHEEA